MYSMLLFFLTLSSISQVFCGNVLVLCPMCSRSHKNIIEATIGGLARRNHSITVVSSFKTPTNSPNIRDIVVQDGFDAFSHLNAIDARKRGLRAFMNLNLFKPMLDGCHTTYKNQEFMKLLNQNFDLIIMDGFCNNCLHPIAHKLNAPVIRSMPLPIASVFAMQTGNYLPSSFVPDIMLPFGEKMNFLERTVNFVVPKLIWTYVLSYYDEYEKIARQYLGEDIPSLAELDSDISMTLVNSHFSINKPRPTMPDVVEIGGVHCRPGRPLPTDLEEFVSGAKDGIVLFSLGSIVKCEHMPEETRKVFVNAFSRIKQRVLWKWDLEDMSDLPSNVKLSKWLPIQDILAHPKTKLFITHGGLLSAQEAIYHGVPMVGVPVFGDQDLNVNRFVEAEIAVFVEILNVQENDIIDAIDTILSNPKYTNNVQNMSKLFRDQPQPAIDTAVFWAEYVMRHKGAPQLRSIARQLNFIQYHSLDVIAFLAALLLVGFALLVWAVKKCSRKLFGESSSNKRKEKML